MRRRDLLRIGAVAGVGVAAGVSTRFVGSDPAVSAPSAAPRWRGHRPGRIYLGMSSAQELDLATAATGAVGLSRSYHRWDQLGREARMIRADHAASRLPWVSFKPPFSSRGGWAAVTSGSHDADIRRRARTYANAGGPVIVTFHHEPHNDETGTPAEFAAAWSRIHDVMLDETGLHNTVSVPVLGEWAFNPRNRHADPADYLTGPVLDRAAFVGLDIYQNRSGEAYDVRLGRVLEWLNRRGHSQKMIGIGETGATDAFGSPSAVQWWSSSWQWAARNADRIGAISYFNSRRNSKSGVYWPLDESHAKLAAFRASLSSGVACRL